MKPRDSSSLASLHATLQRDGYAFVAAPTMRTWLEASGSLTDWPAFAASWNELAVDGYLADHGRYRRRRHAVFVLAADGSMVRGAHQPHYQSRDYNRLYGGIERWFEPLSDAVGDSASLRCILRFCATLFGELAPDARAWHVETHQFRIEARANEPGQPTPEGVHRDGVDYVLVLLIARQNIASGTTTIHAPDGRLLGDFTLTDTFDAALVDDARVFHGVTPVAAQNPAQAAWRDVLVVTFESND